MRTVNDIESRVGATLAMTPRLRQAIRLLRLSATDLRDFVHEQVAENPLLVLENPGGVSLETGEFAKNAGADGDFGDRYREDNFYEREVYEKSDGPRNDDYRFRAEQTLRQYLEQQLYLATKDETRRKIGLALIDRLNESGYLEADIDEIAEQLNVTAKETLSVIEMAQKFDPVGIFARDVEECLRVQSLEKNILTDDMRRLLENIDDLLSLSPNRLAKKCGLSVEVLRENLALLRSLNPRPASGFLVGQKGEAIIPDGFVHKNLDGTFRFELNEDALPKVLLDRGYYRELRDGLRETEDKRFLRDKVTHGNWLIQALRQRFATLERVATAIVDHQRDFFKEGARNLKPMTLRMIADRLDIHESTVSRITSEKYVSTPRGTYELKFFFSQSLTSISEGVTDLSSKSVQTAILELVGQEPKQDPLSDERLVARLGESGMIVARRTIAKYRNILKIPSSQARKNKYLLGLKKA